MALNGALAGLVGITAGADSVSVGASVVIGAVAGVLVVLAVIALGPREARRPVGAIAVHLVCGIWGTLAVGIFGADKSFMTQLIGTAQQALRIPSALVSSTVSIPWVYELPKKKKPWSRFGRARHEPMQVSKSSR